MRAWSLLLLLAGGAAAQPAPLISPFFDRGTVTLRNATALPLAQFFLWNHGLPPEGEDRLEGAALPPGGTRDLVLGMGHCNSALRAVFAGGVEQRIAPVHLCQARELVLEAGPPPTARTIPR
jgi:hypothetical protein